MTVIDTRPTPAGAPNARVATGVAVADVREYILKTLNSAT
jgi:purine nucleosidase